MMTTKAIEKMSKPELREACLHQRTALQCLLAGHDQIRPALKDFPTEAALLQSSEETAQRALDAYE